MTALEGEQVLMRIIIGEDNHVDGKPLHRAIVETLREHRIAGATVLRGILGFGARSHLHTAGLLRLSQDLPIVIEVVDTEANIERILPVLDTLLPEGLVTMEKVRVLRYAPSGTRSSDV